MVLGVETNLVLENNKALTVYLYIMMNNFLEDNLKYLEKTA